MTETKEWVLKAADRCDESMCYARANVRLVAVDGLLEFCSHHYERHLRLGAEEKFAKAFYQIIDERDRPDEEQY